MCLILLSDIVRQETCFISDIVLRETLVLYISYRKMSDVITRNFSISVFRLFFIFIFHR